MSKKKKKKKDKKREVIDIRRILFVIFYICISVYLISYLIDKPFMSFWKGFRFLWIILYLSFIGILGYNIFKPFIFIDNKYVIITFLSLAGVGFLFTVNGALNLGGDSGYYMVLAKSLAKLKGYVDLHVPDPSPHCLYGFGLPLLIAPVVLIFGTNVTAANFVIALSAIGFLYATFLVFKKYIGFEFSILLAAVIEYNWWIYYFSGVIMTEIPFCLFMMLSIYLVEKYSEKDVKIFSKFLFLSAGAVFYAYEIKPIGLALFAAAVIYMFLIKRVWKKMLLFSGLFLIGMFLWNLRTYIYTGSLGYLDVFLGHATTEGVIGARESTRGFGLLGNLFYKPIKIALEGDSIFGGSIFYSVFNSNNILFTIVALLVCIGFIYNIWKNRSMIDFTAFIIFYGIAVNNYLTDPSRYYLPLIPFLYYYIFMGLMFILTKAFSFLKLKEEIKSSKYVLAYVFSVFFILNIVVANRVVASYHPRGKLYAREAYQNYYEMAQWIKKNIPKDAIVASRLNKEMYVFTGIKSTESRAYHSYDLNWNKEKGKTIIKNLKKRILNNDVDFFVLDETRGDSFMTLQTLARNPELFQKMFNIVYISENRKNYVLEVKEEWKKKAMQEKDNVN